MPGVKRPQNFEDFKAYCLKKPIDTIINGYYDTLEKMGQLKVESKEIKMPRKVDVSKLREEIKRLKAVEAKYNRIMAFATEGSGGSPQAPETPKVRKPRKPRTPKNKE